MRDREPQDRPRFVMVCPARRKGPSTMYSYIYRERVFVLVCRQFEHRMWMILGRTTPRRCWQWVVVLDHKIQPMVYDTLLPINSLVCLVVPRRIPVSWTGPTPCTTWTYVMFGHMVGNGFGPRTEAFASVRDKDHQPHGCQGHGWWLQDDPQRLCGCLSGGVLR